jgi:hypothetical protein
MCEIAHAMGLPYEQVWGLCQTIYQDEGVRNWGELMEKIGKGAGAEAVTNVP